MQLSCRKPHSCSAHSEVQPENKALTVQDRLHQCHRMRHPPSHSDTLRTSPGLWRDFQPCQRSTGRPGDEVVVSKAARLEAEIKSSSCRRSPPVCHSMCHQQCVHVMAKENGEGGKEVQLTQSNESQCGRAPSGSRSLWQCWKPGRCRRRAGSGQIPHRHTAQHTLRRTGGNKGGRRGGQT